MKELLTHSIFRISNFYFLMIEVSVIIKQPTVCFKSSLSWQFSQNISWFKRTVSYMQKKKQQLTSTRNADNHHYNTIINKFTTSWRNYKHFLACHLYYILFLLHKKPFTLATFPVIPFILTNSKFLWNHSRLL